MSQFHDGIQQQPYPPQPYQPQQPAPQPPKRHRLRGVLIASGTALAGLIIGLAAGGSSTGAEAPVSVTSKAGTPTVTITAPPAPAVTKTISTVPAACKTALDAADQVIATAGQGFSIVADVLGAASEFDVDGITAATEKLTTLNTKKLTPQLAAYKAARDECQSS